MPRSAPDEDSDSRRRRPPSPRSRRPRPSGGAAADLYGFRRFSSPELCLAVVDGTIIPPGRPGHGPNSPTSRRGPKRGGPPEPTAAEHRAATGVTAASARTGPAGCYRGHPDGHPAGRRAESGTVDPLVADARGPPDQGPLEHRRDAPRAEVEAEHEEPQRRRRAPEVTQTAPPHTTRRRSSAPTARGRLTHGGQVPPLRRPGHALAFAAPKMKHSMEMTPPQKQQMRRAPMTPRVKHTTAFGAVLHVLKGQPKPQGCCGSEHHVMTLFEGGIQAQSTDTNCCGCCEHVYVKVIPKHTIMEWTNSKRYCCSPVARRLVVHFKGSGTR